MESILSKKINYKVAEAVAAVIALPRSWALPTDLGKLASVVYGYHAGHEGARNGAISTAARTTWRRYEREARKLARSGVF